MPDQSIFQRRSRENHQTLRVKPFGTPYIASLTVS